MRFNIKYFKNRGDQEDGTRVKKRFKKQPNKLWIQSFFRLVVRFFNWKSNRKVMPATSSQLTDDLIDERLNHWNQSESELNDEKEAKLKPEYEQVLGEWFELLTVIGHGALGKIYKAIHKVTGEFVAVKIFDKAHELFAMKCAYREIEVLKTCDHPNIIKLYQVIETELRIFVILEFCENGDLFNMLNEKIEKKELTREPDVKQIFFQVVSAVKYLHSRSIAHRDLKLDNVVLDGNGTAKLIDFNSCAKMARVRFIKQDNGSVTYKPLKTHCGTIDFISPEIIRGVPYDGIRSDSWSLGVMLYSLLCNQYPFNNPDDETDLKKILKNITRGVYEEPKHLSEGSKKFLRRLLILEPSLRSTSEEIINDPWFKERSASESEESGQSFGFRILKVKKFMHRKAEALDEDIISVMSTKMTFPIDALKLSISKMNFQTNDLTTYLILTNMKKNDRLGGSSKYLMWKNRLEQID